MKLKQSNSEIFIPDNSHKGNALTRTTHMAIGAHQDDLEIMAIDGILRCFHQEDKWFTGIVVTDGRGSPRDGLYKDFTDDDMMTIRATEQKKAAIVGEYGALILLNYPSSYVKEGSNKDPVDDLIHILTISKPDVVYTHNLADKHDTHVGVALKVIESIRYLPGAVRPKHLYGCEIWRDLDWMIDADKFVFNCSLHENLQEALLGVFDSQICGGKRYDLATLGRRRANATYFAPHDTDIANGLVYSMNLTPLIEDPEMNINSFIQEHINRFASEVEERLKRILSY